MKRIAQKIQALQKFDPRQTILDTAENRSQDIVRYVTEMQLYIEGVRGSDEAFIADYDSYAALTIAIKTAKGQPTDRVTLRDTGAFHESFKVETTNEDFEITADDQKTDELKERYGDGIMALTDQHLHSIKQKMFLPELRKQFMKAAML